jgi:hypothetical protein
VSETSTFDLFRETLAFGLATAEAEGVPIWSIDCLNDGAQLRMYVDEKDGRETVRRLAAALGVVPADQIEHETEKTFSIHSRGPRPFYVADDAEYTYSGPSVPFGDRFIEVQLMCGLTS